jgi:hypothetical protein
MSPPHRRLLRPLVRRVLPGAPVGPSAGDPDRAITIHMREIARAGRLVVAGLRRVPPVWQVVRGRP